MNLETICARNNVTNLPVELQADANGVLQVNNIGGGGTGGSVSVSNFPATQPVSGNVTATISGTPSVSATVSNFPSSQAVTLPASSTSSVTTFTSTSSAQVLAANSSRKGIVLYNQGGGSVFVLLGTGTASATNFSVGLGTSDTVTITGWTGAVQGIFTSAGTLNITELS